MSHERAMPLLPALLLAAVTLTSCTSDPPVPKPLATSSSTASPAPTPGLSASGSAPAAPSPSAEARGSADASATAFAIHYVDVVNHAMVSGDTSLMRRAALGSCTGCRDVADSIDDLYSKSGHVEGDGWRVREVTSVTRSRRVTSIRLSVRVTEERWYATAKAKPETSTPFTGSLEFRLTSSPTTRTWAVSQMETVS